MRDNVIGCDTGVKKAIGNPNMLEKAGLLSKTPVLSGTGVEKQAFFGGLIGLT